MPIRAIGMLMTMSYDRTEFGQRLVEARKNAKLTQEQAAEKVGTSQGNLAELERHGSSSGFTAQLAALYGVDPHWLATGEAGHWSDDQHSSQGPRRPVAQILNQPALPDVSPVISWENIMDGSPLPTTFSVECPDDSMAPFLKAGHIVHFDTTKAPRAGDVVLVRDAAGELYIRAYRPRRPGTWLASPTNTDAYEPLSSDEDSLTIVAVFVGMAGRLG